MIIALNGLLVIFVVSSEIWRRRLARQKEMEELATTFQPVESEEEVNPA
jgi:hypothetical protein